MDYFDYFNLSRDLTKSLILRQEGLGEEFEDAVKMVIAEIRNEISKEEQKLADLNEKPIYPSYDEKGVPDIDYICYIEDCTNIHSDLHYLNVKLISIYEMRVINIFKDLEIGIKKIIESAYPHINTKDLNRWNSFKDFFNTKNIDISEIDGYIEASQIKDVNNQIKHDSALDDKIKKIIEFKDISSFTSESLHLFLIRTCEKVNKFIQILSEKVVQELYEFDDDRIVKIANEYKNRMEKEALDKLKEALSE